MGSRFGMKPCLLFTRGMDSLSNCWRNDKRAGVCRCRAAGAWNFNDRSDSSYKGQPACGCPELTPACLTAWWCRVQRVKLEREFLELQNRAFNAPTQQLVELRQLQTEVGSRKACA